MKKTFQTLIFVLIAVTCFSQMPNSGFENWTSMGSYENPDSWGTMNNTTASSAIYTATKGTPGNPGASYLKLTSETIGAAVVNGIAVSGILDSISLNPKSGFPYLQRAQSFTGKWQHMVFGGSQGAVSVFLTRWNSAMDQRDTVASAKQTLSGMEMSWAAFTINFSYQSGEFPDSCIIILKASGASPSQDDYLYVDDLALSGSVTGISESDEQDYSIGAFPNPADNEIEFTFPKPVQNGDRLIISDITGNIISENSVSENSMKINTMGFANGTYICKRLNSFGVQYAASKFTIQH